MLEDFGVVGVSWRQRGSEALAAFSLPAESRAGLLREFARRASLAEIAYLETCNRVELVFRRADGGRLDVRPLAFELLTGRTEEVGQAARTLKAWQGEGACEHLFLVAAGLDSAALGEADVVGQVRACHDSARQAELAGAGLKLLFEEALRLAAQVRRETLLGAGAVSLAEVAMTHVRARLRRTGGKVALIGVSAMTERAARSLADDRTPFVVVNRSLANAQALAARFAAEATSLEAFRAAPAGVEAVLVSTGAKHSLLGESELARLACSTGSGEPPLCIDMAVPPNVDRVACSRLGIQRIGMDEIVSEAECNRGARLGEAAEARALVDAALPRLRERLVERLYAPLFAALQAHRRDAVEQSVQRLAKALGRPLGDEEIAAATRWAEALAQRVAHPSLVGLKGLLRSGPEGALDAYLGGLDEKLAAKLRNAVGGG